MELAEAERRLGRADGDWDQTLRIPGFGGLVLDPRGIERSVRPEHDNSFRVLQRLLDLPGKPRSPVKVPIPPNVVTGLSKALRELPGRLDIISSIAEKDLRHRPSSRTMPLCSDGLEGASVAVNAKLTARLTVHERRILIRAICEF
jgi:hypothetical protein